MTEVFNDIYELNYELLSTMGLSVDDNGNVYDQDDFMMQPILCEGKTVKASIDESQPVFPDYNTIIFDPITDYRLMNYLLGFFFNRIEEEGFHVITYGNDDEYKGGPSRMEVCATLPTGQKLIIDSRWYNNKVLKLADIILRIGKESDVDLSNFDNDKPQKPRGAK